MKKALTAIWYSLPLQLLLLQFKRFQILLLFWYILFATVGGSFMQAYGANALFLAPEYFNNVSAASTAIVGFALGVFIMSWNITTFITNGNLVSFLATTSQPFLKYCINNALLPLFFLLFYFYKAINFLTYQELFTTTQIVTVVLGFLGGFFLSIILAFAYFFGADKTIYYRYKNSIKLANEQHDSVVQTMPENLPKNYLNIHWFYSARLKRRIPRNVEHYDVTFIKTILSRHHFSAVIAILLAYIFLVSIGFVYEEKIFQLPAAASIVLFFAVLIAALGAFTIFFKKWSLLVVLLIYVGINILYKKDIIDPRNKAYGLNYDDKNLRPVYDKKTIDLLANEKDIEQDKKNYLKILNNWKAKQKDSLPIMFIINTSGGGLRSATFTMNVLSQIDSVLHGHLMNKTLFINGASGGMLGATYYRELQYQNKNKISSKQAIANISNDLLNPIFSSIISRDIIGPVQKFSYNNYNYTKDRGYAFEEKLNDNTHEILNKPIKDYVVLEQKAVIPFALYNSVITRDGRKMIIASNPARFLMKGATNNNVAQYDADAIDFTSYFKQQGALNLRLLSALRMNATFPYALPNVWLPTQPVIDVMDAGLRDNYGIENTIRFLQIFKDWIEENTSKVVILQIRDRGLNNWDKTNDDDDYLSFLTKPLASMQHNWFKLQDYYQSSLLNNMANDCDKKIYSICWQYTTANNKSTAGLSFHLTTSEKLNIAASLQNTDNAKAFERLSNILK